MVVISLTGMILKMRYCIVEEIGSGGEGHLYMARDMELGGYWAIKELPISKKREAKLLRLLEHPSIPKMIDYIETEEACYLVMEFIRGKSLGQLQREGHIFSAEEILRYGDTILQVLEYLHRQKPPVYYGDLKPDNLMLGESGVLYLVDFGSAVLGFGNEPRICMGTRGFAAPEQYEGRVGESSDLYAFGKTLRSLAGRNWGRILWKVPGMWGFVHRCVQMQETKRFSTAAQARKILLRLGKRRGQTRKTVAVALGTAGALLMVGMLLAVQEKKPSFEEALTKATEFYYETGALEDEESRKKICSEAEKNLQIIQKEYTKDDEQRRLLLLLAANAELQKEWERAAIYYEQLLLYAPEYGDGYGKYGLFLLRRGQKESSRKLWAVYEKSGAKDTNSRCINIWKAKMGKG